jgi:hypothetical protein
MVASTVLSLLLAGCEPPEPEPVTPPPAVADSLPPVQTRVAQEVFDGCYYQGQRYSVGGVRVQDGVLKKCVEESRWHNVDGFGNLIPEDPSVEDTLSAPDTTAVADTTRAVD